MFNRPAGWRQESRQGNQAHDQPNDTVNNLRWRATLLLLLLSWGRIDWHFWGQFELLKEKKKERGGPRYMWLWVIEVMPSTSLLAYFCWSLKNDVLHERIGAFLSLCLNGVTNNFVNSTKNMKNLKLKSNQPTLTKTKI